MADKPKITVETLIDVAIEHIASRLPGSPMIASFLRKCPCDAPGCTLEFLINVIPVDHITFSATLPTRIH